MTEDLLAWLSILGVVVTVAGAAAAGAAIFRTATLRRTIADLQESNKALIERLELSEAKAIRLEHEMVGCREEIADKDTRIAVLEGVVTGEAHLEQITLLLSAHHEQAMDGLTHVRAGINDIKGMLHDRRAPA